MSKWRKTFCKKRGFRSGFRVYCWNQKHACGCSAVAFFTRVPPRVPPRVPLGSGHANVRIGSSFLPKMVGSMANFWKACKPFAGSRGGSCWISGKVWAGSQFSHWFRRVCGGFHRGSAGFGRGFCEFWGQKAKASCQNPNAAVGSGRCAAGSDAGFAEFCRRFQWASLGFAAGSTAF